MIFQFTVTLIFLMLSGLLSSCHRSVEPKKEIDQYIKNIQTQTNLTSSSIPPHDATHPVHKISNSLFNCKKQKCLLTTLPLNTLSLVGLLSDRSHAIAFIASPAGTITPIKLGDIISSDYQRVDQISQSSITLRNIQSKVSSLSLTFSEF